MISKNKKIILLVEDESIIALSEKNFLEKYGYHVIIANNGEKAIVLFQQNTDIDIILMDIDLGKGINGPEAAILILKEREIPIVFLSNHNSPEMVEKTEKITSYGYVVKNSGITVLDASIKMAFKLFDANRKISESQKLYLALMDGTDSMIWSVDTNFCLITSNTSFQNRTNLKPGDNVLEKSNYTKEIISLWKSFYEEVLSGKSIKREFRMPSGEKNSSYWIEINLNPIYLAEEIIGIACFSSSVDLRKKAEEIIKKSEADLQRAQEINHIGSWNWNAETNELIWSKELFKIFGFDENFIKNKNLNELYYQAIHPEDSNIVKEYVQDGKAGKDMDPFTIRIIRPGGEIRFITTYSKNFFDQDGSLIEVIGTVQDITERKKADESLILSEERYRMITDSANDAIVTSNSKGIIIDWNNGAEKIFGYTKDEIKGQNLTKLIPQNFIEAHNTGLKRIENKGEYHVINQNKPVELIGLHKNGNEVQIELSLTELVTSSEKLFTGIIRDISERKASEKKIKSLLIEKDLRLKEVHHRIKNNMGTIVSLLSLEAETLKDPNSIAVLRNAGNRIRSMMMLYDKLYLSLDKEAISVKNYFADLIDEIIENSPNNRSVKIQKHIDDFVLDINKIQPIGIIINELLTNIMKYAFNNRSDGLIKISAILKGSIVSIVVEDNGNGIPESIDFENSTGFGLKLIDMLTKQIDGTIRIVRNNGTKIILEFEK